MTRFDRRHKSLRQCQHSRQLAREGVDWFAALFWAAILSALLLGAVAGHARISVAYGADEMPGLVTEMFLPTISTTGE